MERLPISAYVPRKRFKRFPITISNTITQCYIGLTQTERIYYALGRCGAGEARTTSTQCLSPTILEID